MTLDTITPLILGDVQVEEEVKEKDDFREELTLKVIDEVFSKKDIEVKTDLNEAQVIHFSRGHIFHSLYNSPLMLELINTMSIYSVSKKRLGRKEFTDIAKAVNSYDSGITEEPLLRNRLIGKGL